MYKLANDLTAVLRKFPTHEFTVRRLYVSDAEFRLLCEDYVLATCALSRWKDDEVRAGEYRQVVAELEDEILQFIEGRHRNQAGQNPR